MMALLLNANDSVSRSYSITKPSPLHPIVPTECGERTENLWDADKVTQIQVASDASIVRYGIAFSGSAFSLCLISNSEMFYKIKYFYFRI